MIKYLLKRTINYTVLWLIAVVLTYFLASWRLNHWERIWDRAITMPPQQQEQYISAQLASLKQYNLSPETPIMERFWNWAGGVLRWDWGKSPTGGSVNAEIANRILVSVRLLTIGFVGGAIVGVLLGAWVATKQYRWQDKLLSWWTILVIATPTLVIGVTLQILAIEFNRRVGTRVFEVTHELSPKSVGKGFFETLPDRLKHLILPTITLAIGSIAVFSRYQRGLMLDTLDADFVRTARAKGVRRRRAVFKHALRTALIPTGTLFAFQIAAVFTGAVITETVFSWRGMGSYFITSLNNYDIHGVVAVAAFGGFCTLVGAVLSEIFVVALDPRVRVN